MPSPHMSFRLTEYQLAQALRILVTFEPYQPIPSLSQAAKIIVIDWITKNSSLLNSQTLSADLNVVKMIASTPTSQINPNTISSLMAQATTSMGAQAILESKELLKKRTIQQEEDRQGELLRMELKKEREQARSQPITLTPEQQQDQDEQIALALASGAAAQTENKALSDEASKDKASKDNILNSSDPLTTDQPTESVINTVTDFSLPKELLDKINNESTS